MLLELMRNGFNGFADKPLSCYSSVCTHPKGEKTDEISKKPFYRLFVLLWRFHALPR